MIVNIKDFGAVGDGCSVDSSAIQKAIDSCAEAGGGMVVCPPGAYLAGSMELKSHVELYLEHGCRLVSCLDLQYFRLPDDVTGANEMFALLTAAHAEDITISGFGVIDGQCMTFMYDDPDNGGNGEEHLSMDDPGRFRPKLLRFEDVHNAVIKDVTFKDSAFWTIHLAACTDCRISGIRVDNPLRACNSDAIDPDCCKNLIITDCILKTGDDGVCVKSTKALAERYGSCENILVSNCIIHSTSSGLKIGTETFGDIRNVTFSNCQVYGSSHALAVYARDGATIENIKFTNISGNARHHGNAPRHKHGWSWWGKGDAIFISSVQRRKNYPSSGTIRNITCNGINIDCEASAYISAGSSDAVVENVTLENCSLRFIRQGTQPAGWFDEQPSIRNIFQHDLPAIFAEKVNGLYVSNLRVERVNPECEKWTGVAEIENSRDVVFSNVRAVSIPQEQAWFKIMNSEVELDGIPQKTPDR